MLISLHFQVLKKASIPQLYLSWVTGKANHANYEKGWTLRNALGDVLGMHGIFVGEPDERL